jgi:hypothetical protein
MDNFIPSCWRNFDMSMSFRSWAVSQINSATLASFVSHDTRSLLITCSPYQNDTLPVHSIWCWRGCTNRITPRTCMLVDLSSLTATAIRWHNPDIYGCYSHYTSVGAHTCATVACPSRCCNNHSHPPSHFHSHEQYLLVPYVGNSFPMW